MGETGEHTVTTHGVMKAVGEELRSCFGKRTDFPCIVQGPVWKCRGGVTNTPELSVGGRLSPEVAQTHT